MSKSRIFTMENMSFNAIRENIILAKISEFTVYQHMEQGLKLSESIASEASSGHTCIRESENCNNNIKLTWFSI